MPKPSAWQRFKTATSKSLGLVETSASTLDYGMKALELKAFLMRASVITDALEDQKVRSTLQNIVLSDDDSENIHKFVETFRLQNQTSTQTQPTSNTVVTASNLIIH